MPHFIRTATVDDIPSITNHIASLCKHHGETYVADVNFIKQIFNFTDSGITMFLGETDGRPTSFSLVHPLGAFHHNTWRANIHLFHIHAEFRGRGFGRKMIDHIRDWALSRGMTQIAVSADLQNEPTQQIYLKLGFKRRPTGGAHFICELENP
jgi:GNAT superfamily N-acetyltransferase